MKADKEKDNSNEEVTIRKIPIVDILGLGAFQIYGGNNFTWGWNGPRASLLFAADDLFYKLCQKYSANSEVRVCDFLAVQRRLKSEMLSLKMQRGG